MSQSLCGCMQIIEVAGKTADSLHVCAAKPEHLFTGSKMSEARAESEQ